MINILVKKYREYRLYIIFIILLIISLFLITLNSTNKITSPRKLALISFSFFSDLFYSSNENTPSISYMKDLSDQNKKLMNDLNQLRNVKEENNELRSMLKFKEINNIELKSARVIFKNNTYSNHYFIIDVGEDDGVFLDAPVITANGIVGTVIQASKSNAIVKTFMNLDFRVSVNTQNDIAGILNWDGTFLKVNNVPKSTLLNIGDEFFVSGYSSFFPKGIPVGKIKNINQGKEVAFFDIILNPSENLNKTLNVFVIPSTSNIKLLNLKFNLEEN